MKKIFLSTVLIVFVTTIFAQEDTLKGQKGDWGFSIGISGIINNITLENPKDAAGNYVIFARKYIKDDVAIRIGFNTALTKEKWNNEDSISIGSGNTALQQIDSSYSRFDFSISIGYEKHVGKTKRLDPYFAGEIAIGRMGNTKIQKNTNIKDVTGTDKTQYILQYDGGFMFAIGVAAGFNYFIAPKLSLGTEFGYYYAFVKTGGDYNESTVNTPVSGAQSSTFSRGVAEKSDNILNVGGAATIMLSYFF
ncbi:MAG: hypothetical protein A3K10_09405 [Bacteroidetes bacterium RIFCSPLOWO2_12_FULL_31_6]|nr:MAG: hypothetical protein A3K10_09405 [Bacteroidetes bacterium RIFCSPLOWO2_12_FULL_31_6]